MAMGTAAMEEAHDRIGCCTGNNEVVAGLIGNMEEVAAACSETMLSGCGFLLPGRLGRSYSGHGAERRPDSDHGERRPESDHEGGGGTMLLHCLNQCHQPPIFGFQLIMRCG